MLPGEVTAPDSNIGLNPEESDSDSDLNEGSGADPNEGSDSGSGSDSNDGSDSGTGSEPGGGTGDVVIGDCSLEESGPNCQNPDEPIDEVSFEKRTFIVSSQKPLVDILFVVDTSGSMKSIQNEIASKFSHLFDKVSEFNYRIAVTTANMQKHDSPIGSDGQLLTYNVSSGETFNYISPETENKFNIFSSLLNLATSRPESNSKNGKDDDERAIYNTVRVIERQSATQSNNLFREGADLHVIVVSNENERSNGTNLEEYDLPSTLKSMVSQKLKVKSFTAHSIINVNNGSVYKDLSNMTSGLIQHIYANGSNIYLSDFNNILTQIGNSVVIVTQTFTLPCKPLSITLTIKGGTPNTNYNYSISDENVLTVTPQLNDGAQIDTEFLCPTP